MQIKVHSNKLGGIFVEENLLKDTFLTVIEDYVDASDVLDITFDIKRNMLKFINIHFSKKTLINKQAEKDLYNQLVYVLSNKFQITNKIITFSYEN